MADANSILAYRGNPELGGYTGQGTPLVGDQKDHYGEFANMFRDLIGQNMAWNARKYQQAIADRDESTKLFASQDMNHPLEESDRPQVEGAYNKIKDIMLQYRGNPMANPKGRQEVVNAVKEFQQLRALGQSRNLEAVKQRQAIAQETDPETRRKMIDHLDSQLKQGIYKVPDPYFKELDYNLDDVLHNPGFEVVGKPEYVRGKDGIAYMQTEKAIDPKKIVDYYDLPNIMEGNNKTLPNQIGIFTDYLKNEKRFDEEKINEINTKLNDLNQKNQWGIGNKYYQEPIQYTKNDDGTVTVEDKPIDLARKMALYAYGNQRKVEQVPSKEAQTAFKTIAQEQQAKAAASKNYQEGKAAMIRANAMADQYKENARLARLKGDKVEYENNLLKSKTVEPAHTIINALNDVNNQSGYVPARKLLGNIVNNAAVTANSSAYKDFLDNIDNYDVKEISSTNPVISKMVATQAFKDGKPQNASVKPSKIFVVKSKDGNLQDMRIIGLSKNGTPTIVNYSEGAVNFLKTDNGFRSDNKLLDQENALRSVLGDLIQSGTSQEASAGNADQNEEGVDRPVGTYEIDGKNYYWDGTNLTPVN